VRPAARNLRVGLETGGAHGVDRRVPVRCRTPTNTTTGPDQPPVGGDGAPGARSGECQRAAFALAAITRVRRGELCGLQVGDLRNATLVIERAVAYTPRAGLIVKDTKTGALGE
jgi:hypothetical protein